MGLDEAPELAVVLGSGLTADGDPLPSTTARAHRAAQLAHERPELFVICSGDRQLEEPPGGPSEATLMRDLIAARGVAPDRIAIEDESRDTIGNAVLTPVRYLGPLQPRPPAATPPPSHLPPATEPFRP